MAKRLVVSALVVGSLAMARAGSADEAKHKFRISTVAPDGTSWAKAFQIFERDVVKDTKGAVEPKIYLGGIAGTEDQVYKLLQSNKLDGAVSGGPICRMVMPSMKIFDVIGLFQNQGEAIHVLSELRPILEKEAHDAGYALIATGSVGPFILFSREPIASMADLQKTQMWSWDLNEIFAKEATDMKLSIVGTPLLDAQKAYESKKTNGFVTTPVAALAYQWYVGTKYITDLPSGYLMGCFLIRESSLDALSSEQQASLRKAGSKLGVKIDSDNGRLDKKLLGDTGMFAKSGIKFVPVTKKFRADFFEAARLARQHLDTSVVPREILDKATQILADYRAEHD
jgi:TRAP-type C4-dicarboxylate transport system substrate-binding protein